jgi:O-6-methylguanine DNA methyltransferase
MINILKEHVYKLIKKIPSGRISTYKILARECGNPNGARAVGKYLSINPTPIILPCHRIVCSNGSIGGYSGVGGVNMKIRLLKIEGVNVINNKVIEFEKLLFHSF